MRRIKHSAKQQSLFSAASLLFKEITELACILIINIIIHQNKQPMNADLTNAGGKNQCARPQAHSKRTKQQCSAPAERGKKVCRFHRARSTGPKTEVGRLHIAHGKTQHGNETRQARARRSAKSAEMASLEAILFLSGAATDSRTRGRKPASYVPIKTLQAAYLFMLARPLTL
jgi:hypothetical protein